VERMGCGLTWVTVAEFFWRDWGRARKTLAWSEFRFYLVQAVNKLSREIS
jgi:hypothetical protein